MANNLELAAGDEKSHGLSASQAVHATGLALDLRLRVNDAEVVEALSAISDVRQRDEYALAALKVGVLALKQARGTVDAQTIRNEGERLVTDLKHHVDGHGKLVESRVGAILERYFDPKSGEFSRRVEGLVKQDGDLSRAISAELSGEDSKLSKLLAKQLGDASPLVKRLDPRSKEGVVASIEKAVQELLEEQRKAVLGEFDLNNDKSAIKRLLSGVDEMNKALAGKFDLNDPKSALAALSRLLDDTKKHVRAQLDLNDKDSALATLDRKLAEQVRAIAESQAKFQQEVNKVLGEMAGKREEARRGTAHGIEFEHEVLEAVRSVSQGNGDEIEHVGEEVGEVPRSKVGDMRITLSEESACPGGRIVIEAKQDKSKVKLKDARAELEVACKNRLAEVGVFVMSGRTVDELEADGTRHEWTRPIMRFGNHVLVLWHPEREHSASVLDAALSLARALVVRSRAKQSVADWDAIDASLHEIERNAERFADLTRSCDTIQNANEKLRKQIEDLGDKLKESATDLAAQLDSLRGDGK